MALNLRIRPGKAFPAARECYATLGVNVDHALQTLARMPISLHCWQGDDVGGFENFGTALGGGLVATGHYPGKARTPDELRADLEKAFSLIPGKHRLNLHACYGEFGGKTVDRDEIDTGPFPQLDRLGEAKWPRPGFQSDLLFPSERPPMVSPCRIRTRRSGTSGSNIASVCREIGAAMGKAARHNVRHQRLDS